MGNEEELRKELAAARELIEKMKQRLNSLSESEANKQIDKDKEDTKSLKKVISFSLYGDKACYQVGAIVNLLEARRIFPDWTCRVYTNVAPEVSKLLSYMGAEVIDMANEPDELIRKGGMFWRFLPIDDPEVDVFFCRDTDCVVCERDRSAADNFLASGKEWFIVRDHPGHKVVPIPGGMWGHRKHKDGLDFINGKSLRDYIKKWSEESGKKTWGFNNDQRFLKWFYECYAKRSLGGIARYGPQGMLIPPHGDTYLTYHIGARMFRGNKFNAVLPRRGYTADWWRQIRGKQWRFYSQGDDMLGLIDYNVFGSPYSDEMHPRRRPESNEK